MVVAWSIVTDFACAGFPIVILRKLQINPRTKLALWGIMGLGILYVAPGDPPVVPGETDTDDQVFHLLRRQNCISGPSGKRRLHLCVARFGL
jgi:hypothetical protein